MKKKVIIDCDPGIDDSLAILLAVNSEEIDVIGITVVGGNVDVMKCARNAIKTLEICGRLDIPVYLGESKPLVRELATAGEIHGEGGLGNLEVKAGKNDKFIKSGAIDFLLNNSKGTHLITIGPMINLARAITKNKEKFNNFLSITSMGGVYKSYGNTSPVAEFNYWVDPHAVEIVYQNYDKPITMVSLDITRKCVLTPNHRQLLKFINTEVSQFIYDITEFYIDSYWEQGKILGCVLNDPLAVAYFLDNSIADGFYSNLEMVVEGPALGQAIIDTNNFYKREHNVLVLTEVDEVKFMNLFFKKIFKGYEKEIDLIVK